MKDWRFVFAVAVAAAIAATRAVDVAAQVRPITASKPAALVGPQGPIAITMPNGTTIPGATNQLLVFFRKDATSQNLQAVRNAIAAAGAQVVGEIAATKMLQVQVPNAATIASLLVNLSVLQGVRHVAPNLLLANQGVDCTQSSPMQSITSDAIAAVPTAGNRVITLLVDQFFKANQPAPSGLAQHGDNVASFIIDSAGKTSSGAPFLQIGTNLIEIERLPTFGQTVEQVVDFVVANQGKRFVIDFSAGPLACDNATFPDLDATDPARRATARAYCRNAEELWQMANNQGFTEDIEGLANDNVLVLGPAGNVAVPLDNGADQSSCFFLPVGGLSSVSPPTMAPFTTYGTPVPLYAPACSVRTLSLPNSTFSGNSFAAAQAAGIAARWWESHEDLDACDLGEAFVALPKFGPGQPGSALQAKLVELANDLLIPVNRHRAFFPVDDKDCGGIKVTPDGVLVNTPVTLTPSLVSGNTATGPFTFFSSNPSIATVDGSGVVRRVGPPGQAEIFVSAPNISCAATRDFIVPNEIFVGNINEDLSFSLVGPPGSTPVPWTVTESLPPVPMQLFSVQSFAAPGTFSGLFLMGPGASTLNIPAASCPTCIPPITIPALTQTTPFNTKVSSIFGTTTGRVLALPFRSLPPATGTLEFGSDIKLNINWTDNEIIEGGEFKLKASATLTRRPQ